MVYDTKDSYKNVCVLIISNIGYSTLPLFWESVTINVNQLFMTKLKNDCSYTCDTQNR